MSHCSNDVAMVGITAAVFVTISGVAYSVPGVAVLCGRPVIKEISQQLAVVPAHASLSHRSRCGGGCAGKPLAALLIMRQSLPSWHCLLWVVPLTLRNRCGNDCVRVFSVDAGQLAACRHVRRAGSLHSIGMWPVPQTVRHSEFDVKGPQLAGDLAVPSMLHDSC